jgi:TonB family protein
MKAVFIISLLLSLTMKAQDGDLKINTESVGIINPEFPGGKDSLNKFLSRNLVFPIEYKNDAAFKECSVHVKFQVEASGKLSDIKISKGCFGFDKCDLEALRLVKMMPAWKPASKGGEAVKKGYNLIIPFKKAWNP